MVLRGLRRFRTRGVGLQKGGDLKLVSESLSPLMPWIDQRLSKSPRTAPDPARVSRLGMVHVQGQGHLSYTSHTVVFFGRFNKAQRKLLFLSSYYRLFPKVKLKRGRAKRWEVSACRFLAALDPMNQTRSVLGSSLSKGFLHLL